eukprot:CAMPEP_0197287788 /NCGR_PEP_ID=MMETSP0890-20130614/4520_1 /TAXON_ID=44058 ORGANISM="Aureoumbra lagunensis, Strain CCMP1510" /NCGR_SAMPLE_ID=MMETSP0890 /ASSEMBLY_ACC=CAM_ASM_000533 /LENGTH=58 /DNA_ID=CAMNT_0042757897 /DNA_START=83 /DNA_END=259 /DNA_ORIENTATION=+
MAKDKKEAKKTLKKETIEKAKPVKLKSLAKGRINGFGKSAETLRAELMKWCEENGGFA